MKIKFTIILFVISVLILIMFNMDRDGSDARIREDRYNNIEILSINKSLDASNFKVIFVLRLSDFSCYECFANFLKFSYYINNNKKLFEDKAAYFIEKDVKSTLEFHKMLNRWKILYSISFKTYEIADINEFLVNNKSAIIVKDDKYYKVFNFPLRNQDIEYVFSLLKL